MPEPRVAVYIDFDNVVISRYDQIFGGGQFVKDRARVRGVERPPTPIVLQRLEDARVDVGAILDYASSFGSIVISRAYADWSAAANARYQRQLVDRAVDLTQLFNTAGTKNGADIRLAVDVVEDLFRINDVTHVVIVAGDSDYIALAQRSRRLGRFVVGIGVAGSTSRALIAACDDFSDYDALPGVTPPEPVVDDRAADDRAADDRAADDRAADDSAAAPEPVHEPVRTDPEPSETAINPIEPKSAPRSSRRSPRTPRTPARGATARPSTGPAELTPDLAATDLLVRALQLIDAKNDEEWQTNGEVKGQMLRLDSGFKERPLGFKTFGDFLDSRTSVLEIKPNTTANDRRLRLL